MKKPRKNARKVYRQGRKPRPWHGNQVPRRRSTIFLYQRHLALIEALKPTVLAHVKAQFGKRRHLDKMPGYTPSSVELGDVLLFCLEVTATVLELDPQAIERAFVQRYVEQEKQKVLERGIG